MTPARGAGDGAFRPLRAPAADGRSDGAGARGRAAWKSHVAFVLAVFGIWTVLALLSAVQSALYFEQAGRPIEWPRLLGGSLLDWYTCAIWTPALFWLSRHFAIDRRRWPVSLPVTLVATSIFVVLKYAFLSQVMRRLGSEIPIRMMLSRNFISESIILWAVLGVVYAVEYWRRLRRQELQLARVSGELTAARLDALSAQLQPHFLFNSLHGISVLMHRDVEAADSMLASLGDLLRRTLDPKAGHELPLAGELELLDRYLDVVRARFGDRLTVRTAVSADAADILVPRLVLQPLVENALEHGIARRKGAGRIDISAEVSDHRLELVVADDGAGIDGATREGIGLSNTRRRLETLYGEAGSLTLDDVAGGGLRVVLRIPARHEPVPAR